MIFQTPNTLPEFYHRHFKAADGLSGFMQKNLPISRFILKGWERLLANVLR
jgi:hypothetical protein